MTANSEPDVLPDETSARSRGPAPERLSQVLARIAAAPGEGPITLGELLAALRSRAFGALMIVFAFPNILPSPPGLAAVLGLPLVVLSALMLAGRDPWLPSFIARRGLQRETFRSLIARATPWIQRAERLLRHRYDLLTSFPAQRLIGLVCLALALLLMLPVPFGNLMPSLAICILALGVLERDGAWVIAGLITSVAAVIWVGALGYALVKSAIFLLLNAF